MCDATVASMVLTVESTAWAVTFSAGLTAGVILGYGFTPWALSQVGLIALVAIFACARLLRAQRPDVA